MGRCCCRRERIWVRDKKTPAVATLSLVTRRPCTAILSVDHQASDPVGVGLGLVSWVCSLRYPVEAGVGCLSQLKCLLFA